MGRFALQSLFSCIVAGAVLAGPNPQQATHFSLDAADLYTRASQVAPAAGTDVLVLEDQEALAFDGQGKATRTQYILYKILTPKGADGWAQISINWEPWDEERPKIKARVITPDRVEHTLDAATITDAPARDSDDNVFSDQRVMRAPLPAIAPGSVVEEEDSRQETESFTGAGFVERYYFGRPVPVQHTRLVLDAPSNSPLLYRLELLPDVTPQRTEAGGRMNIIFDRGPMDALDETESDLPSNVPAYPNITFATGKSWQQLAEEYSNIVDKQIAGADLKSLVGKVTAGKSTIEEKEAAILQYLDHEIRYTGVEFGEAAVVPRSPAETLTRKYGDCKDKSALLVAMLRAANVPAYVALLDAGTNEDVSSELPGMGMFDHAIVYVPGDRELWIDATDDYARLGQLPIADQNRLALIAKSGTTALVHTSVGPSTENTDLEKREIRLADYGPARIIETSEPHGVYESSYRRSYANKDDKNTKEQLASYVKTQYLADKLDRIDRSDPSDISRQFQLVLECDQAKRGFTDLDSAVAAIRFDTLFDLLPADLQQREKPDDSASAANPSKKKRTSDFQLPDASVTEWQYTIIPPAGFQPKPLPKNTQLSLGPAALSEEFSAGSDGVVHATIRFDTVKRRMTVAEATEMRNQVAQMREGEPILIYFEPVGEVLLDQGKAREALQSYRELIALHPTEAIHHLRISKALLAAGMGEAARSEARTAVKLEPNSALAEKTLAEVLEYDSVGRKFRPGSDFAGAETAYRAVEKLDPTDKASMANLAILLEYDRWGLRYGPGAKLRDSVAEYSKLTPEERADFGLQNNLAVTMFYAGEFADSLKTAQALNPQPLALIVACDAALNGAQSALAEARKRTGGEAQFKQIVAGAGQMLSNLRKYALAADLLDAGASGDNASDTAADAITLRKTQLHEEMQFANDPAGAALHYVVLAADTGLTLDQLRSISSRNGQTAFALPSTVEALLKTETNTFVSKARAGTFPDVGIDMSLARAQPKVEGDDKEGYKVTLWPSANYKSSVFIVKEAGKYLVLATGNRPAALGLEVLDRLTAGDSTGARILLDWLRDDAHLDAGDDPLGGAPFTRLWTRGKDADSAAAKIAAATILLASKETAPRGVALLEENRASAVTDADKANVALALMVGYGFLERYDRALAISAELARQHPESKRIFLSQAFYLRSLSRFDDADALAQDRLKRLPNDIDALRALVSDATARGDYLKAHALAKNLLTVADTDYTDLNNVAWLALYTGKIDGSDAEDALKAAQLSHNNPSDLHTLGCVYAELGKTKQAREVLVEAMDKMDLTEPDPNYWYAFGRIAEQDGEPDSALADYARVTKPDRALEIPDSSYYLAQLRLKVSSAAK